MLREQGIVEALGARDAGDLPVRIVGEERDPASGIVGYPTVVSTCEGVRDGIAPLLQSGAFTVVLGGCCSLVPGVAAALGLAVAGPVGPRLHRRAPRHLRPEDVADRRGGRHAGRDLRGPRRPRARRARAGRAADRPRAHRPARTPRHRGGAGRGLGDAGRARHRHVVRLRGHPGERTAAGRRADRGAACGGRALLGLDRRRRALERGDAGDPRPAGRRALPWTSSPNSPRRSRATPRASGSTCSATTSTWTTQSTRAAAGWSSSLPACSARSRLMLLPEPVALARGDVRLEPLAARHRDGLAAAVGPDPAAFPLAGPVSGTSTLADWLALAESEASAGTRLPFAVLCDGAVAGSSSYFDIAPGDGRIEIGHTWYGAPWRGTRLIRPQSCCCSSTHSRCSARRASSSRPTRATSSHDARSPASEPRSRGSCASIRGARWARVARCRDVLGHRRRLAARAGAARRAARLTRVPRKCP